MMRAVVVGDHVFGCGLDWPVRAMALKKWWNFLHYMAGAGKGAG